jgi:HSP20 family protein
MQFTFQPSQFGNLDFSNTIQKIQQNTTSNMSLTPFFRYDPFVPRGFDDLRSLAPHFRELLSDTPPTFGGMGGFDVKEEDGKYHISVDVPGVKASDMKVEIENDSKVLHIHGGRKVTKNGSITETRFDKRFTIGDNVDVDKLSANLEDGVLVLTAPKLEVERPKTRTIEVSEGKLITDSKL